MSSSLTRRRFLLTLGAASGATLFDIPRLLADHVPGPQRQYGWFPMGIQSYSLRHFSTDEALDRVRKLGLHHVEFFESHFSTRSKPEEIARMLKDVRRREIAISAHGVNRFTKDRAANRAIFDFANLAGIRNISADPDPDSFDSLDELVAEYGIRIAIHNHGPDHRYDKIADVARAIEGRHPWIGACADLGHFIRSGEDPAKAIRELGPRLYGIHLKDFDEPKKDAKGVIIGKGLLDIAATFRALREVHFPADGALSVEYEENAESPMDDLRACLEAAAEGAMRALSG